MMLDFFNWISNLQSANKPWLILGKGPTFEKYPEYDLTKFNIMSLNHVVRQLPAKVAHMIDLDVADSCADAILNNAEFLLMPWIPHNDNAPGKHSLGELCKRHPLFEQLSLEGRLLYYNHLAKRKHGDSPVIRVRYFSSEAAINLLTACGVRKIRTLGIDGGTSYSKTFSDLSDKTLLSNGRSSFNKQFDELARTILTTGVDLAPLDIQSPIKVYVAATEAQMLSVKVLEYSIRKHASMSVQVFPLHTSRIEIPLPENKKNWPRTPFSFQRFLIPKLQNYKGRAIYLDSDMQLFKDIKLLWMRNFDGADILTVKNYEESDRRPQFSVMLLDCERLEWDVEAIVHKLNVGELSYEQLMYQMEIVNDARPVLHNNWNSLERYIEGETALLHYTDMSTQPWVSTINPLGYLWCRDLMEAVKSGFITSAFIKTHIDLGYIRPSLMYQLENYIEDPLLLPPAAKKLDEGYHPPHEMITSFRLNRIMQGRIHAGALARHWLHKSGLDKLRSKIKNYLDRQ